MNRSRIGSTISRIALWAIGNSLAGMAIGLTVGMFREDGIEAPTLVISGLFGSVVGFTAMVSSTYLFPRLSGLARPLRILLLGLVLISGAVPG